MRRFAWYGRLSTKDKQDPTLSFPPSATSAPRRQGSWAAGSSATSPTRRLAGATIESAGAS